MKIGPSPQDQRDERPQHSLRSVLTRDLPYPKAAWISVLTLGALLTVALVLPVPYVIEQPGPAIDVLGEYEDTEVLTISGAETYPTEGRLMMTTVAIDGGPGYTVTPAEVAVSWFDRTRSVMPREYYYPEGQTRQEADLDNAVQMNTSQQEAIAVAMEALGQELTPEVIVAGVLADAPADGVLEAGDVLVSIRGESRPDAAGYQELAAATPAGTPVAMTIRRDGTEMNLDVPTDTSDGTPKMGIVLAAGYDVPFDVTIGVGSVGGPSAGTMFALSVYDELTPGALAGGQSIAGTGTISIDGEVGPIGGIRQKLVGARDAGAEYFLAPEANCDEVEGYVPEGLQVMKVATFDEALHAVTVIGEGGDVAALPTCASSSSQG